jgi:hypothetical protein
VVFFLSGAKVVSLFIVGGNDLTFDDRDLHAFVGSIAFTPK